MRMLAKNGTRHPQLRNPSPEIALNTNTAKFARKNPAGAPNCGQEATNPRWAFALSRVVTCLAARELL